MCPPVNILGKKRVTFLRKDIAGVPLHVGWWFVICCYLCIFDVTIRYIIIHIEQHLFLPVFNKIIVDLSFFSYYIRACACASVRAYSSIIWSIIPLLLLIYNSTQCVELNGRLHHISCWRCVVCALPHSPTEVFFAIG